MYAQNDSQNIHKNSETPTKHEPNIATCLYVNFLKIGPLSNPANEKSTS